MSASCKRKVYLTWEACLPVVPPEQSMQSSSLATTASLCELNSAGVFRGKMKFATVYVVRSLEDEWRGTHYS